MLLVTTAFVTDWESLKIEDFLGYILLFEKFVILHQPAYSRSYSLLLTHSFPCRTRQGGNLASSCNSLPNLISSPEYFFSKEQLKFFFRTLKDSQAACDTLKTSSKQTPAPLSDFLCPWTSASLKTCSASVSRARPSSYKPWRLTRAPLKHR